MANTLGERLKKQRLARGLSQHQLAVQARVSPALISKVEKGVRPNITADVLRRLARILGCSADWLIDLYGDTEEHPTAV